MLDRHAYVERNPLRANLVDRIAWFHAPSIIGGDGLAAVAGWLYAHLFWIMGHPEVYVILIPGVAILMEIVPVFVRKPLFSYNAAILGFAGISGLSVLVWAHHMYMSGWLPLLNGPFMITTEMISVPTGLIFLVILGTLWRGKP